VALLAEQLVEEWMNRQGFFTVRGAKSGVNEIDLLGVKFREAGGDPVAVHAEVQVSFNPIAYISPLGDDERAELGVKSKNSASKRDVPLLRRTVKSWVEKKFESPLKKSMRESRWPGLKWRYRFVHGRVKHREELDLIRESDIELVPFVDVLSSLSSGGAALRGGVGSDIMDVADYFRAETRMEAN
jgi:hypothetical protein